MTVNELCNHFARLGIWRANIRMDVKNQPGYMQIIVSRKNYFKLMKCVTSFMPVCVQYDIVIDNRNWIKNRKKYIYLSIEGLQNG